MNKKVKKKGFYDQQTALTAAKTKIYSSYIEGYLPKLLMTYNKCQIIDLFCGPGKNGKEDGSPLILIDRLNYILTSPHLQKIDALRVSLLFNDEDKSNIDNLKAELNKVFYDKNIIKTLIRNENYDTILPELLRSSKKSQVPTFFFLDPFTYSNVKMRHLQELIKLPLTEILLFIPIFHSYRFSKAEFDKEHQTRVFIEEFTTKGMTNYSDIDDFLSSVREKLLQDLSLKYVRPVLLDGGGSKNALFLLTKHQKGMLLMNKIAFNLTNDGNRVSVNNQAQYSLFPSNAASKYYNKFYEKLIDSLKKNIMTNEEIVEFTIIEGFLPKLAKEELTKLYKLQRISISDSNNNEVSDTRKWNIAEKIDKIVTFKWIKDE